MSDHGTNPLEDTDTDAARAYAEQRRENIRTFVRTSPDYYIKNFDKIGESSRFTTATNSPRQSKPAPTRQMPMNARSIPLKPTSAASAPRSRRSRNSVLP